MEPMNIETAPKDGTPILIWCKAPWNRWEKVRWYEPWDNWQVGEFPDDPEKEELHGIGNAVPTHWLPLPDAPQGG